MRVGKRLRHALTVALIRTLKTVLNLLPRSLALFVGSVAGLGAWACLSRDRYRIHRHLTLAYGEKLSTSQKRLLGRRFFVNSGMNLVDVLRLERHFARELKPRIEVIGLDYFEQAHRRGKGILGVTAHLGNFELMAAYVARLGYKTAVIGRQLYEPRLDELLVANRQALGLANFATTDSPRKLIHWLQEGNVVGVLIDFDSISVRSTFVPAFGRMALTPVGQSLIGLHTGAALVPAACVRLPQNRYRMIFRPEVRIETSGDLERDARELTARCTAELEKLILAYPDQWIWLKNRWLTPTSYEP